MHQAMPAAPVRRDYSLREAEAMLNYVQGADDRETWLAVGMALKSEFGTDAFDAWDRWSQQADNYCPRAAKASWRGFRSAATGGYTIGTVVKLAKDGGYRREPGQQASPAELQELAQRRAARQAKAAAELQRRTHNATTAMAKAREGWASALKEGASPYLQRKLVAKPESIRFTPEGGIVIPMIRYDQPRELALKGLQIIAADGSKQFTYGMEKTGTACRMGLPVVGEPVFVCEGWATGATIRQALGYRYPVFVAFDAYNLPIVTEYIYNVLPTCPLVVCADDDWKTTRKQGDQTIAWNTGRIQAQVAMDGVMDAGAKLVCRTAPLFAATTARGDKDTDFNDLHRLEGIEAVTEGLQVALDAIKELQAYA